MNVLGKNIITYLLEKIKILLTQELEKKADKNQGEENQGKYWKVGSNGELTFDTPFYLNSEIYVTPEQFGAAGDGIADDTEAFKQAIMSEKQIICTSGKTYKFFREIISDKTRVNINGNNSIFRDFRLKINVNDTEDSWVQSYPQPQSVIKNIYFLNDSGVSYCIKSGIPMKIEHCTADNYDLFLKNYGEYMDYFVFDDFKLFNHNGTGYGIELTFLGDQHVFKELHCSGGTNNKFVQISGCNSARFENCLNGSYMIYASTVQFNACHFENDGAVECGDVDLVSTIAFNSCYFWDSYTVLNHKATSYNNCKFLINYQSYGGNNDYLQLNTKNCLIVCDTTGIGYLNYVKLGDYKKDVYRDGAYLTDTCILANSQLPINGSKNWDGETGNYQYTFFPSNNPYSIEYGQFASSKYTCPVTVSSSTSVVEFTQDMVYKDMFLFAYRKKPNGVIECAVIPIAQDNIYDYGKNLNGIKWKTVNSIPNPSNSKPIVLKGEIYITDGDINNENAIVINRNAGINEADILGGAS